MKKDKEQEKKMLSNYEIDNIYMSYRYCIGRHTIASHCHAGDIANHAYGRMTDERMQFMAKDINREIYDVLNVHDWLEISNTWNIDCFRPLDILYQSFIDIGIKNINDLKKIRNIECFFTTDGELQTEVYYYNDKDKFNYRSFWDIAGLEVWQRLANLFDLKNHKRCRLIDDSVVEYYEYWRHYNTDEGIVFEKVKTPIESTHNFTVCKYIPECNIREEL